ncbi:MAG: hypothetical protein KDN18_03190 [Verrucomicrobiae bacterium]|nr:hypothetical protein [Verrucomicrobiae bacterium]
MNDWSAQLQLLSRLPGLVVWILFIAAAFVFLQKRPGPPAFAMVGGGILAFLGLCLSLVCEMMFQSALRDSGAGGQDIPKWMMALSASHWVHLAGALTYSISLLTALFSAFRGGAS